MLHQGHLFAFGGAAGVLGVIILGVTLLPTPTPENTANFQELKVDYHQEHIQHQAPKPNLNLTLVVDLSSTQVYVKQGNQTIKSYPVAIGKPGWETPTGSFRVTEMQKAPAWQSPFTGEIYPPSPSNPIGDRWIGFINLQNGNKIGFHGTPNEATVGQAASSGCLRMRRKDLHDLYARIKVGTPVIVKP
ncbi:MAG: L,D-transpeptidase [Coleofasciculus sp. S288]|nr:L,D-transpeptidase [Coleofasciculus sp. S288]